MLGVPFMQRLRVHAQPGDSDVPCTQLNPKRSTPRWGVNALCCWPLQLLNKSQHGRQLDGLRILWHQYGAEHHACKLYGGRCTSARTEDGGERWQVNEPTRAVNDGAQDIDGGCGAGAAKPLTLDGGSCLQHSKHRHKTYRLQVCLYVSELVGDRRMLIRNGKTYR